MPKNAFLLAPSLGVQKIACLLGASALVLVSGCTGPGGSTVNPPQFVSDGYGITVRYTHKVNASHEFAADYLLPARWNPDAAESTTGEMLLSLTLPKSNHLLDARLRLGASHAAQAVAHCAAPTLDNAPNPAPPAQVTIGGEPFVRVDSGDAAMNHFLLRHSYRGVVKQSCYAIDLVVSGVNPGVYPDNPTPPMTRDEAFEQLTQLLSGISFSP